MERLGLVSRIGAALVGQRRRTRETISGEKFTARRNENILTFCFIVETISHIFLARRARKEGEENGGMKSGENKGTSDVNSIFILSRFLG